MHQLTILTLMFSSVGMHLMKHYFAKKIYCKNKFFRLIEQYRYDNNKKLVSYNDYNNPYGSKEGVLDFNNKDLVSFLKDSDYYSFYLEKCKQK